MNPRTEERLRAAFEAKADQVTEERLDRLAAQRQQALLDGGADEDGQADWSDVEVPAGIALFDDSLQAGDLTPLNPDHRVGTRQARWLAPALAAAAVVAVAVGVTAISTVADNGKRVSNPPASRISTPSPTPTPSSSPTALPTAETGSTQPSVSTPPARVVPLGAGKQAGRSEIPWSQVGPGWTLVLWTPSTTIDTRSEGAALRNAPESLFLVNPVGGRYLITTLPVDDHLQLDEWSGDGRRALFDHWSNEQPTRYSELNLATGAWHDIGISGALAVRYTKPLGLALLVQRNSELERIDRNGARQLLYPTSQPGVGKVSGGIYTPDGSQLVRNTDHGWVITTNGGTVVRTLSLPTGTAHCFFHRWWTATTMLATCYPGPSSMNPKLWLVPITGASATPLLASQAEINDAIQAGSKTFLEQGHFHCADIDLSVLQPDGAARPLNFQKRTGTHQGVHILKATRKLLYLGVGTGCGPREQIVSYDPATDELTTLFGGSLNGGSIVFALGYRVTDPPS